MHPAHYSPGVGWLADEGIVRGMGMELAGLVLALLAVRWGFGGIAKKNIRRLRRLPEQGCFFAFQAWRSFFVLGNGTNCLPS